MDPMILTKVRYGTEDEAYEALVYLFERTFKEFEDDPEEAIKRVTSTSLHLLESPRAKIKKAVFRALAKLGIYNPEIFSKAYEILKYDPDYDVRQCVEKCLLEILSKTSKKKEALKDVISAIVKKGARLSPVDVIRAVGVDIAKEVLNEVGDEEKELIRFGIEELSKEQK